VSCTFDGFAAASSSPPPPPSSPRRRPPDNSSRPPDPPFFTPSSAIVVSLIATAIVPLALSPGQKASDKIFEAKQRAPLDNKTGPGGPKKRSR
jgi:hypothetical protein